MTTATARSDLTVIKARQRETWASGDFAVIASRIVLVSELLADAADLRAGWRVLDVACGNGNATLAAARSNTYALGVDYVPALLESGRRRAAAERLDVEFRRGAAQGLAVADASFDAVLSVFGQCSHQTTSGPPLRSCGPLARAPPSAWRHGPRTGSSAKCSVSSPSTCPARPASNRPCC